MSAKRRVAARCAARYTAAACLACCLTAAGATSDPPVADTIGGGQSVTLEPAPPPANPRRHRAVFVCQESGVPAFTDRPCGSTNETRSLVIATPPPGAAASTTPPSPAASTRPRPVAPRHAKTAVPAPGNACTKLERQLDELNDRMRAGYSAREAARLWQRWRDAKERLRTGRC
jgi:hypothetical protein